MVFLLHRVYSTSQMLETIPSNIDLEQHSLGLNSASQLLWAGDSCKTTRTLHTIHPSVQGTPADNRVKRKNVLASHDL